MFDSSKFGALGFAAGVIALLGVGWPQDAAAQISEQCKADYQTIFDSLNNGDGAKVPSGAISWALSVEKAVNAGESACPKMDAETTAYLERAGNDPASAQSVESKSQTAQKEPGGKITALMRGKTAYSEGKFGTAKREFQKACSERVAEGCYLAGLMTWKGEGGPKQDWRAGAQFRTACRYGEQRACDLLKKEAFPDA